jgi:hypothetical protein
VGLDEGEFSSEVGEVACSPSEGVVAAVEDADADGGSLAGWCRGASSTIESGLEACLGGKGLLRKVARSGDGDEVGVGVLGSLCAGPES